jgi:hypothetical protein
VFETVIVPLTVAPHVEVARRPPGSIRRNRNPGTVPVFAGDGPLRQTLYQRALDLGIADRVRFLGFVNQSALPAVYKAADLMVLPSEYETLRGRRKRTRDHGILQRVLSDPK